MGLPNIRNRLAQAYGEDHRFETRSDPGGGFDLFSVRRDKIRVVAQAGQDMNTLQGKVANVEYQGTFVKVGLNTHQDDEFIIYMDDRAYFENPLNVGDSVISEWFAEDVCHLLGDNNSSGD